MPPRTSSGVLRYRKAQTSPCGQFGSPSSCSSAHPRLHCCWRADVSGTFAPPTEQDSASLQGPSKPQRCVPFGRCRAKWPLVQSDRILPCTTLRNPRRRRKARIVSASSDWDLRHGQREIFVKSLRLPACIARQSERRQTQVASAVYVMRTLIGIMKHVHAICRINRLQAHHLQRAPWPLGARSRRTWLCGQENSQSIPSRLSGCLPGASPAPESWCCSWGSLCWLRRAAAAPISQSS